MKREVFSRTVLVSLLIGMLTLASNIQLVDSDLRTAENYSEDEKVQAMIVEHEISAFELEKLKWKVGASEEGGNYNEIIDGHGTGLRSPTDNEWLEIAKKGHVVERILLDHGIQTPSSIDHTAQPWFPPIGDQDGEGSCTAWAVGYYTKTFQEAKEHEWNLTGAEWLGGYNGFPTPEYQDRIFSPDFVYHLVNGGEDYGSSFYDAISLVCTVGASSWENMPYNPFDSSSWPSEEAWREAPLHRGNSSGFEYVWLSTDDDLVSLKNWIASDHLAVIAVDANQYSSLTSKDIWTLDGYVNPSINHANTIVGYNDNMFYTEEGEMRFGAFKVANSWGEGGWENNPDGCYWISYEAMKQRVGYCMFYRDRIGYDPKLVASFEIDHSERGDCDILIGLGNHSDPRAAKSFSDLVDGGDYPFCSNNIVLDITEFEETVPSVMNQSFFVQTRAGVPPAHSGIYEWYSDGVSYSWFRLNQTFDIPETGATFRFWSYYEIEEDWDYGYVEAHDLDTDEWFTLPGLTTVSTLPERQDNPNCPPEFEPTAYFDSGTWNAFTGSSGSMYAEEMDLTPFANHTIELYFTYWTDPFTLERGWYVDDIEIPEIGFFDDVESGTGNWTFNGWYITTPPPPTTGTFLSFSVEHYHNYSSGSLDAKASSYDVPFNITNHDEFAYAYMHNIGIADITTSKAIVGQGFTLDINVTAVNEGAFTESFNVTVHANTTIINALSDITLPGGNSTTIKFTWNTTGVLKGNYIISANATMVPDEANTADNSYHNGIVKVTIPGDIDGDGYVGSSDFSVLAGAYGSSIGDPAYMLEADIDSDGYVGSADFSILAGNYGKTV